MRVWLGTVVLAVACGGSQRTSRPPARLPLAEEAAATVVATLDAPIQDGQSLVWCSTFELGLQMGPASARPTPGSDPVRVSDLPDGTYYVAAGQDIGGRVRTEMSSRFPGVTPPELPATGYTVYSYLEVASRFKHAFSTPLPISFRGLPVAGFGITESSALHLRNQVQVLFGGLENRGGMIVPAEEFAVDLDRSAIVQLVVARVPPRSTLGATVDYVEARAADAVEHGASSELGVEDVLRVPEVRFHQRHRFVELETRGLDRAEQMVDFRLDGAGAFVKSEVIQHYIGLPASYVFDGPFLIYMKKRGGRPFFVMWVDSTEVLVPRGAPTAAASP